MLTHYLDIADMEACEVPVSAESRERRKMYQVESQRQNIAGSFGDDYMAFLRHCNIRLNICPMSEENLNRVHELTQRTNQMNFSGNRYERERSGSRFSPLRIWIRMFLMWRTGLGAMA